MRIGQFLALTTAALLVTLYGCNQAESPQKVQRDVASAEASASRADARASEREANAEASADRELSSAQRKADVRSADASADAALTQAEGDYRIAVAKCEALADDARKACREQAQATLDMAKANGKASKADRG